MNLGRSGEVPDKVSTIGDLFSMHLGESPSNTFVSKSSGFKLSSKDNPFGVCIEVGDCLPHSS
jgi:hypothetical protein